MEVRKSSYIVEVWKVVSSWLARSSTIKGSNAVEVQKVVPSWLDSLNTVNDSYAVDAWSSSYTTKVCKFSTAMEARTVVLSWFAVSSTIKISMPWKCEGLYQASRLHRVP